jgi:hypothetical protein
VAPTVRSHSTGHGWAEVQRSNPAVQVYKFFLSFLLILE